MLEKVSALWSLFRKGEAVADPAKWKSRQVTSTMLAALLIAAVQLAKAFGYEVPIDNESAMAIAGGIIAVFNTVFTIITSKHAGVGAMSSGTVREAESPMPSVVEVAAEKPAEVQVEDSPDAGRGSANTSIDDEVRARAAEWIKRHSATNGLQNDA
jgi:uncharacterized membrane protein